MKYFSICQRSYWLFNINLEQDSQIDTFYKEMLLFHQETNAISQHVFNFPSRIVAMRKSEQ